jgi:tryptophanyl-tRNA synthetase
MKRILSGIQATGDLHIGNYLGMMKPCAELQKQGETFYFIPNLHSLNVRPNADKLRRDTLANVAWLLALGIDPDKSMIYAQSQIPAHSELCWVLNNYVTMGELSRMTQYKDKSGKWGAEGQLVGLFAYPVLMAADILLYEAELIPVGEDQKQHVELARDVATRFNNAHGQTFVIPKALMAGVARVMSLQDPATKMSKSDPDQSGVVRLLDDPDVIRDKVRRAVTDSGSEVQASDDKPALTNLLAIYAGFSGLAVSQLEEQYAGQGYGKFKTDLADLLVEQIEPLQKRFAELMEESAELETILARGAQRASAIANDKLLEVKAKIGLL